MRQSNTEKLVELLELKVKESICLKSLKYW